MKSTFKTKNCLFFALLLFCVGLFANTKGFATNVLTAKASGAWSSSSTWTITSGTDATPQAGDAVIIAGGFSVTVDGAMAAAPDQCASIQLGSGSASGTLTFVATTGLYLTCSGTITLGGTTGKGTLTQVAHSFLTTGGLALAGSATNVYTETSTSEVIITNSGTLPSTIFTQFGNLCISNGAVVKQGVALTISDTLVVASGTFDLNGFNVTPNDITYGGIITNSSASAVTIADANTINGTFSGYITQPSGTISLTISGTKTATFNNTINNSTFTGPITLNSGSTFVFSSDGNLGAVPSSATPNLIVLNGGKLEPTATSPGGFTINANRGIELTASSSINASGAGNTFVYNGIITTSASAFILTKVGAAALDLGGSNSFNNSALSISNGIIGINSASNLNGVTAINLGVLASGNNPNLQALANVTLTQPIAIANGYTSSPLAFTTQTLSATTGNTLTLSGQITGAYTNGEFNLTIGSPLTTPAGTGTVALTNSSNSFAIPIIINGGALNAAADGDLGATPGSATRNIVLAGGTLAATAGFTLNSNREIIDSTSGTIDVASTFTLTYNGILSGGNNPLTTTFSGGTLDLSSNTNTPISLSNLTISAGTFKSIPGTLTLSGNLTNNGTFSGTYGSQTTSTLNFQGSGAQTISGSGINNFENLTINNAAGVTSSSSIKVGGNGAGALALTSGLLNLTSNQLALTTNITITGGNSSNYIVATGGGNVLQNFYNTPQLETFPIGDGSNYTPITVNLTSGSDGSTTKLDISTTNAEAPNNTSSSNYLNRYWTITPTGSFGTTACTFTATCVSGDVIGSESGFVAELYNGTSWANVGTVSTNTITATVNNSTFGNLTAITAGPSSVSIAPAAGCTTLAATVTGGTTPLTYSWSTGATTSSVAIGTGSYSVTVTDADGLTVTASYNYTILTANASVSANILCYGTLGTAVTSPSGGVLPYTYQWNDANNQQTPSATGLTAGGYTITVTDNDGCTATGAVTITGPTSVLGVSIASYTNSGGCSASGTATANAATGGTSPYTYSWTPTGGTNLIATALAGGTYTITAEDNNGCTATASVTITQPGGISITIASHTNIPCYGGNGSATANPAVGGTSPYTYSWAPTGGNTTNATGLTAGSYTITATDNNGCANIASVIITQPTLLSANASVTTNVLCNGGNTGVALSSPAGGTSPYTYQWNDINNQQASSATGLSIGSYTVTVTDNNHCTAIGSVTITQPSVLSVSAGTTANVLCYGGNVGAAVASPAGGTSPYTYSWSAGKGTNVSATGLTVGTYTVTVTDNNSCTASSSAIITQPLALSANTSVTANVLCHGGNGGSALSSPAGGTSPYTYSWSGGHGTNSSATGLTAGTYTVTVNDNGGCTTVATVIITQPSTLTASAIATGNVSCNGGNGGSASFSLSGGTSPYTYLWSNSQTTPSISGLNAGIYTVTANDNNGCTATGSVAITQPGQLRDSVFISQVIHYWDFNNTPPSGGGGGDSLGSSTYPLPAEYSVLPGANPRIVYSHPVGGGILDNGAPKANQEAYYNDLHILGNDTAGVATNNLYVRSRNPEQGAYMYLYLPTSGYSNITLNYAISVSSTSGANYNLLSYSTNGGTSWNNLTSAMDTFATHSKSNGPDSLNMITATPGESAGTAWTPETINFSSDPNTNNNPNFVVRWTFLAPSNTGTSGNDRYDNVSLVGTNMGEICDGGNTVPLNVGVKYGTPPYTYSWSPSGQTNAIATNLGAGTYTVNITDAHGCSASSTYTISQPTALSTTASVTANVTCNGGNSGSASANPSGGTSPYTYSWAPVGGINSTATGLSLGIYTVTVNDNCGASATASVSITQPALLLISTSQTNVLCYRGVGSATASISGGTSPYTYSWNDAGSQAAATATGLSAGNYTVTVTDLNGCNINASINITQPSALAIGTSQTTNVSCYGGVGSATASVSGGTSPYTYLWNDGSSQSTVTATGLSAGSYTVTVTDLNGCNINASINITQPSALAIGTSQTNVLCHGGVGGATASVSGGTSPYTYSWSNGQTTATATGLSAGIYTLTATDNNGCIINASVSITQPLSSLKISTSQTNVSCYGGVGNATASVSGGTSPYTYLWNDASSQATATATGLTAGSYTIIATDNNGCTINTSVTLTEPLVLAISTSESNVLCYGGFGSGTASVSGGVSPYTYLWNDGSSQVTASATGLSAGNYTVSVTDNHGCSINASVTITEPASGLAANASITTNVLCYGSNTGIAVSAPSGGTSPYTYLWSNNETAASATGLSAGNYTVTVSDNHGCSTTAGITIIEPSSALGVSISGHTNGSGCGSNGNATASISGGTSPYTYLWSNTETTATATGLAGGTFTITATDNHGCVANATVVITQAPEIAISIASQTNVLCYGGTGSAVANAATGGTSPYTYMWSNGKSTLSVTGLSAGNYTITATGHNGCSTNAYVTITQPAAALESSVASLTNASCHGEHGSASIGVSGGTSPYTYSWTPNVSSVATASGLTAGTYTVIVKDLHGCADAKVTVIITQPGTLRDSLVADSKLTELDEPFSNVSCNGGDNGKITIGVKAGTAPYTYSWTPNVSTTATATGLTAGTYSVLVTDKNGCSGTAGTLSITITQPTGLRDSISVLTEVACNGETGAATIGVKGGTSPYTYVWEPIGKTKAAEIGLSAGIYTVTVTDHNGCGNSVVVTITQPAPIRDSVIAASYLYPLCHGEATGSATVGIKGGTSPYTYTWSKGATNNTTAIGTGLSAGTYTVVVKDAHGCEEGKGVVIVVITQPGSIRDSSVTVDKANVSCNGGNNGQITVGVKYGTPPYTYTWTPNVSTTATATGLTAGTYTISITDINACSSSVSTLKVVVTQPSVLRDSLIGLTQISCNGGSGSVGVGVKGGTSPYTYAWSPIGKTTAKISDLTVGTYTVTVTDKHGCGNTLEAIITQPGVFYDSVASISYPVCHGETGSATVGVKGGTSPYTYSWSKGAISTTGSATGLLAGTYTLTIEDAHKCTEIKRTIVITQPAAIRDSSIVADRINISCNGGDNGSATAGVRYGVSPFTYLWSPGDQTTATATGLTAGTYTLTVTDNNGCSSTTKETAIITQPSVLTATIANVCKAGVGSFTASGSGGVSPYTYSWNNGSTNKEITGLSSGVFTVTVTDKNGCEATAEASVCPPSDYTGPTGENTDSYSSNQAIDIVLYPNPNTGQFTITGLQKEMLIEVYSYTGQRIRSLTTNGDGALQMSLSDQPNGIYLIRILSSNGNILSLKKVVKTQ